MQTFLLKVLAFAYKLGKHQCSLFCTGAFITEKVRPKWVRKMLDRLKIAVQIINTKKFLTRISF